MNWDLVKVRHIVVWVVPKNGKLMEVLKKIERQTSVWV